MTYLFNMNDIETGPPILTPEAAREVPLSANPFVRWRQVAEYMSVMGDPNLSETDRGLSRFGPNTRTSLIKSAIDHERKIRELEEQHHGADI